MEHPSRTRKSKKKNKRLDSYLKYSGLAFQMLAVIAVFTFGGIWADGLVSITFPVFTISLSMTGTFLSLYLLYRSVKSDE